MLDFSPGEYARRLDSLRNHLAGLGADAAVLNKNSDIYYYTGSIQPLYLVVPASDEPFTLARKAIERIRRELPHIKLEPFTGSKDLSDIIHGHGLARSVRIALTLDAISYASAVRLRKLFGEPEIADLSWDIRKLRMVKSEAEIAIQARAGRIMAELPQLIESGFRPGMTELEFSAMIENFFRLAGHAAFARFRREGIEMPGFCMCSAGTNSLAGTKFEGITTGVGITPAIAYGAGRDPIPSGAPVIVDFAFNLDGYHVDQTRMFCWGTPTDEVLEAYSAMLKVEQAVLDELRPGRRWEEVYALAAGMAGDLGYGDVFMGFGPEQVKFVGHGVGLEIDEPPYLAPGMSETLAEGMVLAVEPKAALPEIGVVGVEDTAVIRATGAERLTTCPSEFIVYDT